MGSSPIVGTKKTDPSTKLEARSEHEIPSGPLSVPPSSGFAVTNDLNSNHLMSLRGAFFSDEAI